MILTIRSERKKRGWTLTEVTRRTGIATADLSALERGLRPPYPGWRRKLARVFRMAPQELFKVVEDAVGGAKTV